MHLSKLIESFQVCVKFHKFFHQLYGNTVHFLYATSISIFVVLTVLVFAWHQLDFVLCLVWFLIFPVKKLWYCFKAYTNHELRTSFIWHPSFCRIDIRFFVQKCLAMWMVSIFTHTFASNKKAQKKKEEICLFTLSKRIWSNKTKTITVYCIDDTIQSTTPAEIYSITSWTVRWNEIRV